MDSRYVLNSINGSKKNTKTEVNIQHLARHLGKQRQITFCWVPGHSGSQGNDRADMLAKKAASSNQLSITFDKLPISYIHRYITEKINKEWQKDWSNLSTGRTTYCFLPSITGRQAMGYLTPSYCMTQLLTGHGNLPSYLHRIKKRDNNYCSCDNTTIGDISHTLLDCPLYDAPRGKLITQCAENGKTWPPPWEDFLSTKKNYSLLEKFITECGIFDHSSDQACMEAHSNRPPLLYAG
ncbi:uncharacterized protein LOC111616420 [Centruroides sculpturatus]|uniref:uncharacterized protein LOC111616420 n=1 Tax=Centruroides sculpturatus TaxID=218467 RepID=UPI000C6EA4CF|nr:uncharacterized protein LOC111616420 [Centruroides sculpturatus]